MAQVKDIVDIIQSVAPLSLQESYDNSGLLTGDPEWETDGALLCIDVTEEVIDEAIQKRAGLIISHHPLIFHGLKRLTGENAVQKCIIKAIKHDIAIYAAHTNMDNILEGVNGKIADKLELINRKVLLPGTKMMMKLITFVPEAHVENVKKALFDAGGGMIGNYDSCSFSSSGTGSFRPDEKAHPFAGTRGKVHFENETRIEIIFPGHAQTKIVKALLHAHPYEEPAYDLIQLQNDWQTLGSGLIGDLPESMETALLLRQIKKIFGCGAIRHTALIREKISRVAVCGGSGSFLLKNAIAGGADIFISADFKYHDFFETEGRIVIADIGHFESEQFTKDIFYEIIRKKIPTFALHISEINTNPIIYL